MPYFVIALIFLVAATAIGVLCFKSGYAVGWHDRGVEMALPDKALKAIEKDIDERAKTGAHSAIDPRNRPGPMKRSVWHEVDYG